MNPKKKAIVDLNFDSKHYDRIDSVYGRQELFNFRWLQNSETVVHIRFPHI